MRISGQVSPSPDHPPNFLLRKHIPNLLICDNDILHRILSSLEVIEMVVYVGGEEHLC
jgi:hypothetical protein